MSKTIFEKLSEIHNEDIKNSTSKLGVCPSFVSANKNKNGGVVTMGVPEEVIFNIAKGIVVPVLLIINKEEFNLLTKYNYE